MSRTIDIQALKTENFQLKNQITDLKNGFDLNKDVLKILSQQIKHTHPKSQIFYQIISRLTGINNQIMLANVQLIQEKNKLTTENRKLQNTINHLSEKLDQLMIAKDCLNPKEIHMQMKEQIKQLRSQILSLQEESLRKKLENQRLQNLIKELKNQQLKKPIIPSVKNVETKYQDDVIQIQSIPIKFGGGGRVKQKVKLKNLERQNVHLKRLVQQLQYRLTLLSRIYEIQPPKQTREREYFDRQKQQQQNFRRLAQNQLNLLMFALNNTHLQEDGQSQGLKLTITKRCRLFLNQQQKAPTRSKSVSL